MGVDTANSRTHDMDSVKLKYGVGSVASPQQLLASPAPLPASSTETEESVLVVEDSIRSQCMKLVERIEKREEYLFMKEKELSSRAETLIMVDTEREKLEREKMLAAREGRVSAFGACWACCAI